MAKRNFQGVDEDSAAPGRKRLKRNGESHTRDERPITNGESLKLLLAFHQDDIAQYRLNLQRFRQYLADLSSPSASESLGDGILLSYLNKTTVTNASDQIEIIPDIFQAWRYAVQVYDDGLVPTIPGILALLVKTISSSLEFVDVGRQICRTVMRKENVQLLQKSMNSSRTRDTTLGRCLDLLTQIVSFDGGVCARSVWQTKSATLSRLHQFMGMSKKTIYGTAGSTSVRDHAIPFFLVNLRYQDQEAKAEILSNRKSAQIMLRDILSEPLDVAGDILSTLKQYVIQDRSLGRSAKGHLLTDGNLEYVLAVMRQSEDSAESRLLRDLAETFLIEGCTSRGHGIIYRQHGWYPIGTEELTLEKDIPFLGGAVHSTDSDKFKDRVPVRNTTLAAFIQDLKPWASIAERKLILGIFEAAPELIADYFVRKKAFSFEPKLTATWIGWATFICSVIKLPSHPHEMYLNGRIRKPPPVVVALQSFLPQSLTSQALHKALKQQSQIIKLFTVRILVAAFEKLQQVLSAFQTTSSPVIWQAFAGDLLKDFQSRVPEYKQILMLYQTTPKDKHIFREAICSLLALYHTTIPSLIDTKFDVSSHITNMLGEVVKEGHRSDASTILELQHLLAIGGSVIEAKWWQKSGDAKLSTVTIMIQLLTSTRLSQNETLKDLVRNILEENFALRIDDVVDAFGSLLKSLSTVGKSLDSHSVYAFLDDCLLRLIRKPIKYQGDVENLVEEGDNEFSISPIFLSLLEQWPFFVKAHTDTEIVTCAQWLCSYMIDSAKAGQSISQLRALCKQFRQATEYEEAKHHIGICESALEVARLVAPSKESPVIGELQHDDIATSKVQALLNLKLTPSPELEDYPALTKWQKKDVSEAVLDKDITSLIYCLASTYQEIRIQACTAIKLLMNKVQSSTYEERQPLYLLLGTLQETILQHGIVTSLPNVAVSFAANSVAVLSRPLHPMYTKVNHFLSRTPFWNLAKLTSYWMDRIFHKPPTQIDAHWKEVDWLLDILLVGLRNIDDTNLYRRTGVFERMIVNCTTMFTPRVTYEKSIDILYRCAIIGGATMLITRFGILAWIASQKLVRPKAEELLSALESKIRHECDEKRVSEWSHGSIRSRKESRNEELDYYEKLQKLSIPTTQGQSHTAELPIYPPRRRARDARKQDIIVV